MTEEKIRELIRAGFSYSQILSLSHIWSPGPPDEDPHFDGTFANCWLDVILEQYSNPDPKP